MFFEAMMKGKKYNIQVLEGRNAWTVNLQKEGEGWVKHEIPKDKYQTMDDAVCFLYKNGSYMIDVVGNGLDYTVYTRGTYKSIKIMNDEMLLHESLKKGGGLGGGDSMTSGMPGKIVKVFVKSGQSVEEGQPLLVMEAMKMENEMRAGQAGKIKKVHVKEGDSIEAGVTLVSFEKNEQK